MKIKKILPILLGLGTTTLTGLTSISCKKGFDCDYLLNKWDETHTFLLKTNVNFEANKTYKVQIDVSKLKLERIAVPCFCLGMTFNDFESKISSIDAYYNGKKVETDLLQIQGVEEYTSISWITEQEVKSKKLYYMISFNTNVSNIWLSFEDFNKVLNKNKDNLWN